MQKSQENLLKQIKKLPHHSGVYKFLDAKKKVLYVGKATDLQNRVRSYFAKDLPEKRSPLIAKMISEARGVGFEKTDSVLEALLLESNLIKKLKPDYNTADKDQKSFNYVVITKEEFPRILLVRERILEIENSKLKISEAFGPFPHGRELKEALKIIRKIFPFRDRCVPAKGKVPHPQPVPKGEGSKPCFNYQIGLCPGVCIGKVTPKEYRKTISHIKTFFEGNKKKLIKDLEKEMKDLSKKREFEKAGLIKKKIFALKHIQDVALIKNEKYQILNTKSEIFRIEAYDIAHISGSNMVGVMTVVEGGEVNKNEYRKFKIKGQKEANDTKALKEVLERRFGHPEWKTPDLVVVDGGVAQLNTAQTVLKNLGLKIPVVAVTKDERHKAKELRIMNQELRIMVEKNRREIFLANSEAHRFALGFHRKLRGILI